MEAVALLGGLCVLFACGLIARDGWAVERVFLARYVRGLIERRNRYLAGHCESAPG